METTSERTTPSRRTLLKGLALGLTGATTAVLLNACSDDDDRIRDQLGALDSSGSEDSSAEFQVILDRLSPGPHIIEIPSGRFRLSAAIKMRSDITIRSGGGDTTFVLDSQENPAPFLLNGVSNVLFDGIRIDFGTQTTDACGIRVVDSHNVQFANCSLTGGHHAIIIEGPASGRSSVTVKDCIFSSTYDYAVRSSPSSSGVTLVGNRVTNLQRRAAVSPSAFLLNGTDHIVRENVVESSADTAMMTGGSRILIEDNDFRTDLVCVFAGSGASDVLIQRNLLRSARDFGVHVLDSEVQTAAQGITVAENRISQSGKSGIQVESSQFVAIKRNFIENPCQMRGTSTAEGWLAFQHAGIGIGSQGVSVDGLRIERNEVRDLTGRMQIGIHFAGRAADVSIMNNLIEQTAGKSWLLEGELLGTSRIQFS